MPPRAAFTHSLGASLYPKQFLSHSVSGEEEHTCHDLVKCCTEIERLTSGSNNNSSNAEQQQRQQQDSTNALIEVMRQVNDPVQAFLQQSVKELAKPAAWQEFNDLIQGTSAEYFDIAREVYWRNFSMETKPTRAGGGKNNNNKKKEEGGDVGTIQQMGNSFMHVEQRVMLHVWVSPDCCVQFYQGWQRVWQTILEHRIHGIHAPLSYVYQFNGTYVSATAIPPVITIDTPIQVYPGADQECRSYLGYMAKNLATALRIPGSIGGISLAHARDGRFYVVSLTEVLLTRFAEFPLNIVRTEIIRESMEGKFEGSNYEQYINSTKIPIVIDELLKVAKPRIRDRDFIASLALEGLVSKTMHAHGANLCLLYHLVTQCQQRIAAITASASTAAQQQQQLEAPCLKGVVHLCYTEMTGRVLKACARADIFNQRVEGNESGKMPVEVTNRIARLASNTKDMALFWDEHFHGVLRHKYRTPGDFYIPHSEAFVPSALKIMARGLRVEFSPQTGGFSHFSYVKQGKPLTVQKPVFFPRPAPTSSSAATGKPTTTAGAGGFGSSSSKEAHAAAQNALVEGLWETTAQQFAPMSDLHRVTRARAFVASIMNGCCCRDRMMEVWNGGGEGTDFVPVKDFSQVVGEQQETTTTQHDDAENNSNNTAAAAQQDQQQQQSTTTSSSSHRHNNNSKNMLFAGGGQGEPINVQQRRNIAWEKLRVSSLMCEVIGTQRQQSQKLPLEEVDDFLRKHEDLVLHCANDNNVDAPYVAGRFLQLAAIREGVGLKTETSLIEKSFNKFMGVDIPIGGSDDATKEKSPPFKGKGAWWADVLYSGVHDVALRVGEYVLWQQRDEDSVETFLRVVKLMAGHIREHRGSDHEFDYRERVCHACLAPDTSSKKKPTAPQRAATAAAWSERAACVSALALDTHALFKKEFGVLHHRTAGSAYYVALFSLCRNGCTSALCLPLKRLIIAFTNEDGLFEEERLPVAKGWKALELLRRCHKIHSGDGFGAEEEAAKDDVAAGIVYEYLDTFGHWYLPLRHIQRVGRGLLRRRRLETWARMLREYHQEKEKEASSSSSNSKKKGGKASAPPKMPAMPKFVADGGTTASSTNNTAVANAEYGAAPGKTELDLFEQSKLMSALDAEEEATEETEGKDQQPQETEDQNAEQTCDVPTPQTQSRKKRRFKTYRRRLELFYEQHAPQKLTSVTTILQLFAGREEYLFGLLNEKYLGIKRKVPVQEDGEGEVQQQQDSQHEDNTTGDGIDAMEQSIAVSDATEKSSPSPSAKKNKKARFAAGETDEHELERRERVFDRRSTLGHRALHDALNDDHHVSKASPDKRLQKARSFSGHSRYATKSQLGIVHSDVWATNRVTLSKPLGTLYAADMDEILRDIFIVCDEDCDDRVAASDCHQQMMSLGIMNDEDLQDFFPNTGGKAYKSLTFDQFREVVLSKMKGMQLGQ